MRQPGRRRGSGRRCSEETGLVAMCGHTRRFNPSHQWVHERIRAGDYRHPADGRADVLLPAHQHERARPAAELDRPSALAPRRPHGRPVRLPDRGQDRGRPRVAGPTASRTRHRHGHVDPTGDGQRCHLHAVAVVQQRGSVRHDVPVHRRHGDVCRELRRPRDRARRTDRRVRRGGLDERHRTAGPRVLRGDRRGTRAERQRRPGARLLPRARPPRTPSTSEQLQLGSQP